MYLLSLLKTPLKFVREMVTEVTSAKTEMIFDKNWLFGPRSWASDLVQTASKSGHQSSIKTGYNALQPCAENHTQHRLDAFSL